MRKKRRNKQIKIAVFHSVSAILIVLFWFILYYFFENHGWLCSFKEECLLIHQHIDWEGLNIITFCIVYFLIDVVNYQLTDLSFWNYALIQAILDFALFSTCMLIMERISWFAPITGVNGFNEYTKFRAMVQYFQQYISAFFVSYLIMAIIYSISVLTKRKKKEFINITWLWDGSYGKKESKKEKQKKEK